MMRALLLLISLCMLTGPAAAQAQVSIQRPERVATFPHDTGAFTQGLFFADGALFESTGQVGESNLRRVDLATGEVLAQADLPGPVFGEGSTRIGDEIFVLTWRSERGFVFNADTLEQTDSFTYPGEGWGLATDGSRLIMSDGSATLRFLDPADMALLDTLEVRLNGRPVPRLNELEWVNGEIWANVWMAPQILRINPETGDVTGLLDLRLFIPPELRNSLDSVLNGIAYDDETGRIFITGKRWPVLYEIRLPEN